MIVALMTLAGGAGAAVRYGVDDLVGRRRGRQYPLGTLLINVTGSLLAGILVGAALDHGLSAALRTVLVTGFCGGYTTFSTAAVDTVLLARLDTVGRAAGYIGATIALSAATAALGVWIG